MVLSCTCTVCVNELLLGEKDDWVLLHLSILGDNHWICALCDYSGSLVCSGGFRQLRDLDCYLLNIIGLYKTQPQRLATKLSLLKQYKKIKHGETNHGCLPPIREPWRRFLPPSHCRRRSPCTWLESHA